MRYPNKFQILWIRVSCSAFDGGRFKPARYKSYFYITNSNKGSVFCLIEHFLIDECELYDKEWKPLDWGQISEHCASNMTSQLIVQCCQGWPNYPTYGVQQCVIMCIEQCWRGMSNFPTFVEQQIKYILSLIFLKFSFERIAQSAAHSLHKREVPGSSSVHGT